MQASVRGGGGSSGKGGNTLQGESSNAAAAPDKAAAVGAAAAAGDASIPCMRHTSHHTIMQLCHAARVTLLEVAIMSMPDYNDNADEDNYNGNAVKPNKENDVESLSMPTSTAQRPVAVLSPPCSSMSTRYPVTGSTASSLNTTPSDASPRATAPCVHPQPRPTYPLLQHCAHMRCERNSHVARGR